MVKKKDYQDTPTQINNYFGQNEQISSNICVCPTKLTFSTKIMASQISGFSGIPTHIISWSKSNLSKAISNEKVSGKNDRPFC